MLLCVVATSVRNASDSFDGRFRKSRNTSSTTIWFCSVFFCSRFNSLAADFSAYRPRNISTSPAVALSRKSFSSCSKAATDSFAEEALLLQELKTACSELRAPSTWRNSNRRGPGRMINDVASAPAPTWYGYSCNAFETVRTGVLKKSFSSLRTAAVASSMCLDAKSVYVLSDSTVTATCLAQAWETRSIDPSIVARALSGTAPALESVSNTDSMVRGTLQ
mmetsp:Transcript_2858/g.10904  ORF Transcript_2858/g.10904 Transcript_2858/m.10904 type:complete len:221 (-) Transcript_2858:52-714(-)